MSGRGIDDLDARDAIGRRIVLGACGLRINVRRSAAGSRILAIASGTIDDDLDSILRIGGSLKVSIARLVNADIVVVAGKRQGDEWFAAGIEEQFPQIVQTRVVAVRAPAQPTVVREEHAALALRVESAGQPCDLALLRKRPLLPPLATALAPPGVEEDDPPPIEVAEMLIASARFFRGVDRLLRRVRRPEVFITSRDLAGARPRLRILPVVIAGGLAHPRDVDAHLLQEILELLSRPRGIDIAAVDDQVSVVLLNDPLVQFGGDRPAAVATAAIRSPVDDLRGHVFLRVWLRAAGNLRATLLPLPMAVAEGDR